MSLEYEPSSEPPDTLTPNLNKCRLFELFTAVKDHAFKVHARSYLTQFVNLSVLESQLPHKIVNFLL